MMQQIVSLIKLIHSDRDPRQISLGLAFGLIPGFTPLTSPHNLLVLLLLLFLRANISAALLSWGFFSIWAFALDPLFHRLGLFLLIDVGALVGLWTALYNAPLMPFTRFNNSVVLGSLIVSLILFYPVYSAGRLMIVKYRETFMEHFNRWKVIQVLKASSLYRWYTRYSALGG
jgi:uncharacterized protein (TIGR03546 family)